jgi:hypothetical protein
VILRSRSKRVRSTSPPPQGGREKCIRSARNDEIRPRHHAPAVFPRAACVCSLRSDDARY